MSTNTPAKAKGESKEAEVLGITEAARLVRRQAQYVRKLVIDGKIEATKSVVPNTTIPRWEIDKESLLAYFSGENRRTVRKDGRNKWVIYATKAELTKAKEVLKAAGLAEVVATITQAYDAEKAKAYRAKRTSKKGPSKEAREAAAAHPNSKPVPVAVSSKGAREAAHAKA